MCTKASALPALELPGSAVAPEDIAAFGDMPNDLPHAPRSGPLVRHVQRRSGGSRRGRRGSHRPNDEDGVALMLERFVDTLVRRPSRHIPVSTVREGSDDPTDAPG